MFTTVNFILTGANRLIIFLHFPGLRLFFKQVLTVDKRAECCIDIYMAQQKIQNTSIEGVQGGILELYVQDLWDRVLYMDLLSFALLAHLCNINTWPAS